MPGWLSAQRTSARRYLLSLPERLTRAVAALLGGAVYETSNVALPYAVREAKLYQVTLDRLLRIMIEWVGDVPDVYLDEAVPVQQLAQVHRECPGAGQHFGRWLVAALDSGGRLRHHGRLQGLPTRPCRRAAGGRADLSADADVASYEELLSRLETSSGVLADAIDVPPMSVRRGAGVVRLPAPAGRRSALRERSGGTLSRAPGDAKRSAARSPTSPPRSVWRRRGPAWKWEIRTYSTSIA